MNSVGKPAANPHVRFDERGSETEPLGQASTAPAPFLDNPVIARSPCDEAIQGLLHRASRVAAHALS